MKECKERVREASSDAWQREWERNDTKGQWTKRLIGDVRTWVKCSHRKTDYYLTQALSGYGSFRSYTKRIGKEDEDNCFYCSAVDTVEHTLFECERWSELRESACMEVEIALTPENVINEMLESESKWKTIHRMIEKIMSGKENEERSRQSGEQN